MRTIAMKSRGGAMYQRVHQRAQDTRGMLKASYGAAGGAARRMAVSGARAAHPFNWSGGGLMGAGLGVVGGGAAFGYAHGRNQAHFPMLEARNISMATPTTQRLNYSTVGLTQALHDRRGRRF